MMQVVITDKEALDAVTLDMIRDYLARTGWVWYPRRMGDHVSDTNRTWLYPGIDRSRLDEVSGDLFLFEHDNSRIISRIAAVLHCSALDVYRDIAPDEFARRMGEP